MRICQQCGREIKVRRLLCSQCNVHPCNKCGREMTTYNLTCWDCRMTKRTCSKCKDLFTGNHDLCAKCRIPIRECIECGTTFRGNQLRCAGCRAIWRQCITCEYWFISCNAECNACRYSRMPKDQWTRYNNARRARKFAAEIAGPVSTETYERIRLSGPCVYCGDIATTVDHIRPLSKGGHEAEYNLVPSCGSCNSSKNAKLLIEWKPERVAYAISVSELVNAEYEIQLTERIQ